MRHYWHKSSKSTGRFDENEKWFVWHQPEKNKSRKSFLSLMNDEYNFSPKIQNFSGYDLTVDTKTGYHIHHIYYVEKRFCLG